MQKLLQVAAQEINYYVHQWGFYVTLLGLPLLFAALGAIPDIQQATADTPLASVETVLNEGSTDFETPTGYVDQAGAIKRLSEAQAAFFWAYPDEKAAQLALEAGKIESYYIIMADYFESGNVVQYTRKAQLFSDTEAALNQVLKDNLLQSLDNPNLSNRLLEPVVWIREGPEPQLFNFMPPDVDRGLLTTAGIVLAIFAFTTTFGGNLILRALRREVSVRVLEMIMSSTTPAQFIGGKLLGISLLTLGQSSLILIAAALVYGRNDSFGPAALPLGDLLLSFPYLLFGYLAYAGLMMTIAAIWPNTQENAAFLIIPRLLTMAPALGVLFVLPKPDRFLAVILSTFPLTAPLLMPFRILITEVPLWQWALGVIACAAWATVTISISMRIFRANTLLTGRSISLKALGQALRN